MANAETTLRKKPRRALRFSLRSLVLFVLLLANILFANRDYPWQKISEGVYQRPVTSQAIPALAKVVSPRERIVVTPSDNGYLSVRNVDTGELVRQLQPNGKRVCCRLEFTPDGRRLITQYDQEVILWNAETWEPIRNLSGTVLVLDHVPDYGGLIVLDDGSVTSVDDGRHVANPAVTFYATVAAFSTDKGLLLIANRSVVTFYATTDWARGGVLHLDVATLEHAYFKSDGSVAIGTIDAYYRAPPGFVPPITCQCWRRTAPWGYDSNWYRIELWTLPIVLTAFLISLWRDRRDLRGACER